MAAVARNLGPAKVPQGPELPAEGAYLWSLYCELDDARDPGMSFAPLSETDLFFFALNRRFRWTPFELGVMRALDRAHRAFVTDAAKKSEQL